MYEYGAADTDEVVSFEDILDGKCGPVEAAFAQDQADRWRHKPPCAPQSAAEIKVDDTGHDMRVGTHSKPFHIQVEDHVKGHCNCPLHDADVCLETTLKASLLAGNRAGKRNRVIHAFDEHEHLQRIANRNLRDRTVKNNTDSLAAAAKLQRKRRLEHQDNNVKRRKPGRPPGRCVVLPQETSPCSSNKAKGIPSAWQGVQQIC